MIRAFSGFMKAQRLLKSAPERLPLSQMSPSKAGSSSKTRGEELPIGSLSEDIGCLDKGLLGCVVPF